MKQIKRHGFIGRVMSRMEGLWTGQMCLKCTMVRGGYLCSYTTPFLHMHRAIFSEDSFVADLTWDTRSQKTFGPQRFQERSRYKRSLLGWMIAIDWSTGIHWYTSGMYGMWLTIENCQPWPKTIEKHETQNWLGQNFYLLFINYNLLVYCQQYTDKSLQVEIITKYDAWYHENLIESLFIWIRK